MPVQRKVWKLIEGTTYKWLAARQSLIGPQYVSEQLLFNRGVMVIIVGNGHGDMSSNPGCISHSTNTLGKGMNPIILPPAMGK